MQKKNARLGDSSHKIKYGKCVRKHQDFRRRPSGLALFLRISTVQSHYWRTKLCSAELSIRSNIFFSKNCLCRRGFSHFTLSFCRGWQTNVQRFIMHVFDVVLVAVAVTVCLRFLMYRVLGQDT